MLCTTLEILTYLGKATSAGDGDLAVVNLLRTGVERSIEQFLGYKLTRRSVVEVYPRARLGHVREPLVDVSGNRAIFYGLSEGENEWIQLRTLPVWSVTEIRERYGGYGQPFSGSGVTVLNPSMYYLDVNDDTGVSLTGKVYRYGGWPGHQRSFQITYDGGVTTDYVNANAPDLKLAFLITMSKAYLQYVQRAKAVQEGSAGTIASERLGDYSVSYARGDLFGERSAVVPIPPEAQILLQPYVNASLL